MRLKRKATCKHRAYNSKTNRKKKCTKITAQVFLLFLFRSKKDGTKRTQSNTQLAHTVRRIEKHRQINRDARERMKHSGAFLLSRNVDAARNEVERRIHKTAGCKRARLSQQEFICMPRSQSPGRAVRQASIVELHRAVSLNTSQTFKQKTNMLTTSAKIGGKCTRVLQQPLTEATMVGMCCIGFADGGVSPCVELKC